MEISTGDDSGAYYVARNLKTGRYLRLHPGAVVILRLFDGTRTSADVAQELGNGATTEKVHEVAVKLAEQNLLLYDETLTEENSSVRDRTVPLGQRIFSLTLATWNPDAFLDRHRATLRLLVSWPGWIVGILAILGGILIGGTNLGALQQNLATPPLGWGLIWLVAALLLFMCLHEFAHAVVLKSYGGSVPQVGVMLFYLMPALFCNTNDTWRLRKRRHRLKVVSAGIFFQFAVAGAATILFGFSVSLGVSEEIENWLTWFIVANFALAVSNLVPFIKQDGYWMLVAGLDEPNLRSKALSWAGALARRPFNKEVKLEPLPSHPIVLAVFGGACALFAPLCIGIVLLVYRSVFASAGQIGEVTWLVLATIVILTAASPLYSNLTSRYRRSLHKVESSNTTVTFGKAGKESKVMDDTPELKVAIYSALSMVPVGAVVALIWVLLQGELSLGVWWLALGLVIVLAGLFVYFAYKIWSSLR